MKRLGFLKLFLLLTILFGFSACGSAGEGARDDVSGLSNVVSCANEEDCDEDGVDSLCDEDDLDSGVTEIVMDCDEDEDGFVDTACSALEDVDDDGFFGEAERLEYGVNCDVCPGMTDPEQEDADGDGVGDLCAIEVSVGQSAAVDDETDAVTAEDIEDSSDDQVEIIPLMN